MDDILIRTDGLPQWLTERYFKNTDLISIETLIGTLEDVSDDLKQLQEEFEDFKQEVNDNYKFVGQAEQVGYNEQW